MEEAGNESGEGRKRAGHLAVVVATGFGAGFSPFAPGTVGTLWGVPLAWGLERLAGFSAPGPIYAALLEAVAIVAICVVGIPICTTAARHLGGLKDPGSIVLDEIASLPIAFYLIPLSNWKVAAAGFVLHRVFDISKPPPARQLERLPEGLGIMADDWAAAVYANLALRAVIWSGLL
jgi:phosphatidylglycerophosphatase A